MSTINSYYRILQVSKNASPGAIKKAYRKRAKELHPDVNRSGTAHEDFILLNEAYEYFLNKEAGLSFNEQEGAFRRSKAARATSNNEWQEKQREEARRRAAQFAKMEYEKFRQTKFYRNIDAVENILDYLQLGFFILLVAVLPIAAAIIHGTGGLIMSLVIVIATVSWWAGVLRTFIDKWRSRG